MLKKLLLLLFGLGCLLLAAFIAMLSILPELADKGLNPVKSGEPLVVSDRARSLHSTLFIADLHAETLLWKRDLRERSEWGQVDLPRLREGNVAWQTFSVVTRTPRGTSPERNELGPDQVALLALIELWPYTSWRHPLERALYQAKLLRDTAARSDGQLIQIRSRADIEDFLKRRQNDPRVVAGLLGLVGGHALEGNSVNIDRLFDAGYRMIGLARSTDAGSGLTPDGRLTETGRTLVRQIQAKRMILDLAHHPPELIDDVLAISAQPIVVSTTGVREVCPTNRNLDAPRLKAIAASGGLIGIGYSGSAVCGSGPTDIALSIRYAVDLIGADHVALGSGFDAVVTTPFDTSGLVWLTEVLLKKGLTEDQIRKVMGENVLRFYRHNLQ